MGANMGVDITNPREPKLSLGLATGYFAESRKGRRPHKSRILRYITLGVLGPGGVRVYLAAVRQGNQWVTTPSAIQAFCDALTPGPIGDRPSSRASTVRSDRAERAGREIEKRGI
jgi:hypothetical protein